MRKYTDEEIKKILNENELLKKENHAYKAVVSSRRFGYAEKIATVYNRFLPKSSKRRSVIEGTYRVARKPFAIVGNYRKSKINRKITKLARGFNKIIVIDSIPWDDKLKQRPHHLAKEFRKLGFFVVYFEGSNYVDRFREVEDGIVTINSHIYLKDLPKQCENCFFVLPNTMATPIAVIEMIIGYGYKIIYEYIDEFHGDISGDLSVQLSIWDKLKEINPVLCVASAKKLMDDLKKHLGARQKIVLAPNAVFTEHFNYQINKTSNPPADLKKIVEKNKEIIGFYGALAPWIDFDLINNLAKKHREWEIVLLGIDYNNAAKELSKEENIHNLGPKKYETLSNYAHFFNCAIIPFKHGKIAKATSPIKLFEYMAAGLPTVCTRDLKECSGYDYVYMAKDDVEFEKDIIRALKDYKKEECRKRLLAQAEENTWTRRAEDISKALIIK